MTQCLLCNSKMRPFIDNIQDWEYAVQWNSKLFICDRCGLVSHEPAISGDEITMLYPASYLAHSPASNSGGLYGRLKQALARRTAARISRNVPLGGTFLEIGCGNGQLLQTIASLRPDIHFVGVDIQKIDISGLDKFTFYHGQFENIEIELASIDLIYCSNLIEHVPDPVVFAKKIKQTLVPGGQLLGVTPDHLSLDRYLFGRYWAGYHYPRHTFVFNHRNILTLLQSNGFENATARGTYSFWYLSLANRFMNLPGTKKRGLGFALVTMFFLPIDLLINLFRCHGSMVFSARSPSVAE